MPSFIVLAQAPKPHAQACVVFTAFNTLITCIGKCDAASVHTGSNPEADPAIRVLQSEAFGLMSSQDSNVALKAVAWTLLILRPLFFIFMLVCAAAVFEWC